MGYPPGLTAHDPQDRTGDCIAGGVKPGSRISLQGGRATLGWLLLAGSCWAVSALQGWELSPSTPYASFGFAQGPFTPAQQIYRLTNTGDVALAWSTSKDQPWFSVQPWEGLVEPGQGANLTLFFNSRALELEPDTYSGSLTVTNWDGSDVSVIDVALTIGIPGPATIDYLAVRATNHIGLEVTGLPGTEVVVEASTNLLTWEGVSTNVLESKRLTILVDLLGDNVRFFRSYSEDPDAVPGELAFMTAFLPDPTRLVLSGDAGGTYLVESSLDGLSWAPAFTNKIPADGQMILTNHLGGESTNWMFRTEPVEFILGAPLHQVLIIGQSLGIGSGGKPALSTELSPVHYKFFGSGVTSQLTPLVEVIQETMASGLAHHVTDSVPDHAMLFSNTAMGGAVYDLLKRGTEPYEMGIHGFREAPQTAAYHFRTVQPTAIFAVHGEGDHVNPQYGLNIRQWQENYERDMRNVTGRDLPLPMFHSQASAWSSTANGSATHTAGAFLVLEESERNPDRTILVCPKYQFTYADGIHLTNASYRWLGEYYARAYRQTVIEGSPWTPLRPASVTRLGTNVSARFEVPKPPLVLDTNLVSDPGNFGFEYYDGTDSPPAVVGVEITGPDTLQVFLDREPAGGNERLRYAFTGIPDQGGGPLTGPRGNLRDSDDETSLYGNPLYNWCVHFDKPVTQGE